ncbi:hypothetical protein [Hoeflea poritis]|uniref:Uncharacterized protein n=1 Tax=Hoeflea poritis TaxID=2993659 RepID=A0ABT4VIY7_9HYPH|nr:hypothetical protein [Hoeflea poritis]MDA4844682.1 hypothetical protein [Hoeflea poritis]
MLYIFNKNDGVHIAWNGEAGNGEKKETPNRGPVARAAAWIRTYSAG